MITVLLGLAGGLGAATRFVVDGLVRSRFRSSLPVATISINVSGSLLLGLVAGLVIFGGVSASLEAVVGTGFLGGYTTFSTSSVETVRLVQQRRHRLALVNLLGTAAGCVLAALVGVALARAI